MQPRFGATTANLDAIETALAGVRDAVVVLPELCTTGYVFASRAETRALAEPVQGPTVQRLRRLARANHLVLCCGMAEQDGAKLYNSAVTLLPSGRVHVYRKAHLFDREKLVFDRATPRFEPIGMTGKQLRLPARARGQEVRAGTRLGVMICFDWIFPEVCRSLALAGARVILHPSNLVLPYCQAAMVTRAVENRVFTATCNRVGTEERAGVRLRFTGQSRIVDPRGRVLAQAGEEEESLQIVDIDPAEAADKRITSRNDLFRDRRAYRLG